MIALLYLNQEVPACVVEELTEEIGETNITIEQIQQAQEKLESDILVVKTSGLSMSPVIKNNSRCLCMRKDSYEVGDIVAFFANFEEGFQGVAHEIVWTNGTSVITKGVNNDFLDNEIGQENILCFIPKVRRYQILTLE